MSASKTADTFSLNPSAIRAYIILTDRQIPHIYILSEQKLPSPQEHLTLISKLLSRLDMRQGHIGPRHNVTGAMEWERPKGLFPQGLFNPVKIVKHPPFPTALFYLQLPGLEPVHILTGVYVVCVKLGHVKCHNLELLQ